MITQTVTVKEKDTQNIIIGRRGTWDTEEIVFDISYLIATYGDGVATLMVKRAGDTTAYPAVTRQEDNRLIWTVGAVDTSYKGHGECELFWFVDEALAKSVIYGIAVLRDIGETSETPPDPYETWIDTLTELGAETLANAQAAANSADAAAESAASAEGSADASEDAKEAAEASQEAAEAAKEAAEEAVEHYPKIVDGYWYVWLNGEWVNTGVKAEGVDGKGIASVTGQKTGTVDLVDTYTLTVTYTDGTTDTITFTVTNGRNGTDGYSPTATVSKTGSTATITITDMNGTTTATIPDGTDGVSPAVTVTPITGGHEVTITDKDHPTGQTFEVLDGEVTLAQLDAVADTKAPVIIDTASGPIASFPDGADGMPVKDLTVSIEPIQDLHGYDSPWPAGGGKNLWDIKPYKGLEYNVAVGTVVSLSDGADITVNNNVLSYSVGAWGYRDFKTKPLKAGTYYVHFSMESSVTGSFRGSRYVVGNNGTNDVIKQVDTYGSGNDEKGALLTVEENDYIVIYIGSNTAATLTVTNYQIESGSAYTSWSPWENLCPISGRTGCEVVRTGKNLCEGSQNFLVGIDTEKATLLNANGTCLAAHVVKGETYVFSCTNLNRRVVTYWDEMPSVGDYTTVFQSLAGNTFTAVKTGLVLIYIYNATVSADDGQVELGSTATSYEPYSGETIPISWQTQAGTVYGGTLDVTTGVLTVDRAMVDLGTLTWSGNKRFTAIVQDSLKPVGVGAIPNWVCSALKIATPNGVYGNTADYAVSYYGSALIQARINDITDAATFKTAMSGVQLVYELAQPQTYQLDPVTVQTLLGQNNIFADCGDVEVEYCADTKLYIDKKLAALVAALS